MLRQRLLLISLLTPSLLSAFVLVFAFLARSLLIVNTSTVSLTPAFVAGILATLINVALMVIKIGVGVVGNSYALIADGIESASDILTSLITWVGFHISLKPADEDHPYATLAARDDSGTLLGEARVGADFRLSSSSAAAWVDGGFRRPG